MTLPAPCRRSTAAERRANRAAFKALKDEVDAKRKASPQHARKRVSWRVYAERDRCQQKVQKALAGVAIRPFTPLEIPKIKPEELQMLRAEVGNRVEKLSAEQRETMRRNSWLLYLGYTPEMLAAIATGCLPSTPDIRDAQR